MMQSHMAHKFRKRQEATENTAGDSAAGGGSEMRRALKHGSTVHQLRSMHTSSATAVKSAKARCEKEGLGVAGASCSSTSTSISTALVRSASSNNKHH